MTAGVPGAGFKSFVIPGMEEVERQEDRMTPDQMRDKAIGVMMKRFH